MAPLKTHPLDQILGTQATVRVLRVLTPGGEHAPPRIARDTKTSRPAVREALIRLQKEGVVERVGDGRNVLYRISSNHPLAKRIVKLFKTEAKRGALVGLLFVCASSLFAQGITNAPTDGALGSRGAALLSPYSFTVLDQDIMTVSDNDILKTSVVATYIGGKSVYERK